MAKKSPKAAKQHNAKPCPNKPHPKLSKKTSRAVEAIFGTVFTVVFFILFNVFYDRLTFLSDDFDQIKSLYNLTLVLSIIFNATRIVIHSERYKAATELVSHAFFFYLAYWMWVNFPFNTSVIGNPDTWDKVFRGIIIGTTFAVGIGTVVNFAKLGGGGGSLQKKSETQD